MNFQTLCIVMVAGLCGPLLSAAGKSVIPVIVGELAAGALLGTAGLKILDPSQPTFVFLANAGFVMLMFAAGMHVPVDSLARSLRAGLAGAAASVVLALGFAAGIHAVFGGPVLIYAILMANSSAAIIVPLVQERGLDQQRLARTLAWVTIADTLTIVTLPLVLDPSRLVHATVGALAVVGATLVIAGLAFVLRGRRWVAEARAASRQRGWALELRVSLIGVFALAAVAQRADVSLMLAGFSGGLLLAALGGPKRLDRQVAAVAQGFFVPVFFVSLGAQLNVLGVFAQPMLLGLTGALVACTAGVHYLVGRGLHHGAAAGLLASAQLGLPAAVADLGLKAHVITPGQAAAIMLAGLGAVAVSVLAASRLPTAATGKAAARDSRPLPDGWDTLPVVWRERAAKRDLAAAERHLAGRLHPDLVKDAVGQWQAAAQPLRVKAREVLDAAGLEALPASNVGVARKLSRLARGKPLSPVLMVRPDDGPAIVADGYRRACAGYVVDREADVAVLEARVAVLARAA